MDSITEQLSQLQELNDEQIEALEASALSAFEDTEKEAQQGLTPDVVGNLEKLANAVVAVRTEKSRRVAEQQELANKAAEAANLIKKPADDAEPNANPDPEGLPPEQPQDAPLDEVPAKVSPGSPDVPVPGAKEEDTIKPKPHFSEESTSDAELSTQSEGTAAAEPAAEAAPAAASEASAAAAPAPAEAAPAEAAAPAAPAQEASAADQTQPETAPASSENANEASAEEQTATTEAPAEASSESESTTAETPAAAENTNNNPEAPVTAAAQVGDSLTIETPEDRKPQIKPAATVSITAGADIPNVSAGTKLDDMTAVAEAMTKRLHSLRHVHGGDGEQHIVASLEYEFPEDRVLTTNDPGTNTDLMQRVTAPEAVMAAAGICLPLETRYDLGCDLVGVTDRPVRDSLARFNADRGGIRWFNSPVLTDYTAATGFWRGDANGQNWATYGPDGTTPTSPVNQKPCLEVQCVTEEAAFIEAVTLCLTFNNLTTRVFPELMRRHNELAMVAHARVAENHLLAQLEAGSTAITAQDQVVGATREIMNLLGRAIASYRHKNRLTNVSPLRMVAPSWLRDLLKADIALQMPGDGLDEVMALTDARIDAWFRARNVNITWHIDGVGPAVGDLDDGGAGTAVGFEFPGTIEFGLWAEGTWVFLDGGTLDLGVIRDSSLVATNQYKQFVETFEGLANMGCDSFWVTAEYVPTGQAASLVDTLA